MTIFRRLSKNTVNAPDVLEASPRPSAFLLGDFENKDNLVVSSELQASEAASEDASSTSTSFSNNAVAGMDDSMRSLSLAQAFNEFSVKMDTMDDSVVVSMEVPPDVPVEDLLVQVDAGILRVTGDVSETEEAVEQSFQLDEQALDVDKMTANLNDGVLTITAPKKDSEDATCLDTVPILDKKPPKVNPSSYNVIILDLPGVSKENIHVAYTNGKLRIAGNRHFGRVRSFKRTIPIDVQKFDAEQLQTYLFRGRLAIMIPPKAEQVPRTIEIDTDAVRAAPRAA